MENNDNEINVKLAIAIGWPASQVRVTDLGVAVGDKSSSQIFDYKDQSLLWKLCVVYDAFPTEGASLTKKEWIASSGKALKMKTSSAATPELAAVGAIMEASKTYKPKF